MVVKTLGREAEETERFAAKAHELRDVNIRAGRIRAAFDPTLAALPNLGVLRRARRRRPPGAQRRHRRRRRRHRRLPAHHRLVPDPLDRLAARRVPAQRRRLPPGPLGARAPPARWSTATRALADAARAAPGSSVDAPRLRLRRRTSRCSTTSRSTVEPGPHRRAGRRHRLGQEHPHHAADPAGRPRPRRGPGRRHRPARPGAAASWPSRSSVVPQTAFLFDDTVRGNVTLGADVPDERGLGGAAHRPGRRLRRRAARRPRHPARRARHLAVRRPAAADLAGPRPGAPAAAAGPRRRHVRRRPRGRGPDPRRAARRRADGERPTLVVVAYRKATIALADEVVYLAGGRIVDRGTHAELLARNPAYADLVNAYEQEPQRRGRRDERRADEHRRTSRTSGTRIDTGDDIARAGDHPPRHRLSPELREGIGGTLVLAVVASLGQVVVPIAVQQTLDRGLNGPGGPDVAFVVLDGRCWPRSAIVLTSCRVVPDDQPAVPHLRARPRHAADQGVPARPRPAAAHPEHRAPRRPGLPGHQRRRPGQPVPGLRRPHLRRQRRPDAGRHRGHARLQLAARARGLGLLRAAVPLAALLPAQALRRPTAWCAARSASLLSAISEPVVGAAVVRSYAVEERTQDRIDHAIDDYQAASTRAQGFTAFSFSLGGISAGLANAGVLIVGIWLGFAGDITAGRCWRSRSW